MNRGWDCAGSTPNAMLWLPGAGCTILVVATQGGFVRRIPLAQAASLSLFAQVAKPLESVCTLAYSHVLKLVGYGTGAGLAAVLACVARVNVSAIRSHGLQGTAKTIPTAALCQVNHESNEGDTEDSGRWVLLPGDKVNMDAPAECAVGTLHTSAPLPRDSLLSCLLYIKCVPSRIHDFPMSK